ncbi:Osmotin, thaumatin-like protein [Ceratobasidium sp. AG-I]|nr:Osmotin, thaumatin-like protein [Ceratobasidium sp. AG-I]
MKSAAKLALSLFVLAAAGPALARNFTVLNACSFTIWPAVYTDTSVGAGMPAVETGWEAPPMSSRSFTVPDTWTAGRIWPRTGCNFTSAVLGTCATGGCLGGLKCTGPGVGPNTVTEWTIGANDSQDYYDVSLVDGFNVPIKITNNQGCAQVDCAADLILNCPAPLKGAFGADGKVVGCMSACEANLDGTPTNSKNCCTGQYSTPATCPPSGVQYYSYFKSLCPRAYNFPYDSISGSLFCSASKKADYTITFCP